MLIPVPFGRFYRYGNITKYHPIGLPRYGNHFAFADDEGNADIGLHDWHTVFPGATQHSFILCLRTVAERRDDQESGAIEDRYPGDVIIPPVVTNEETTSSKGGIEGTAVFTEPVEPPGMMVPLRKLHLVVFTPDASGLIDEDGTVVYIPLDFFRKTEGQAYFPIPRKGTETAYDRTA